MSMIQPKSPLALSILTPLPHTSAEFCWKIQLFGGLKIPGRLTCFMFLIRSESVFLFLVFYLLPTLPVSRKCLFSSPKQHLVHSKQASSRLCASALISWKIEGFPYTII